MLNLMKKTLMKMMIVVKETLLWWVILNICPSHMMKMIMMKEVNIVIIWILKMMRKIIMLGKLVK